MTPAEAIKILDNVCSQVSMNRADHVQVVEAVRVLTLLYESVEVPSKELKNEVDKSKNK